MAKKKGIQRICFMLMLIIVLTGICGEDFKANSLFACGFIGETDAITTNVAVSTELKLCTTDMIQGNNGYVQRLVNRYVGQKKDFRFSFDCVCTDIYLLEPGKCIAAGEPVLLTVGGIEELMIRYVHRADGKKRV